jgi:predicted regulator of Ras-like GTPase activity (Roadblock/LC7/MglB family)
MQSADIVVVGPDLAASQPVCGSFERPNASPHVILDRRPRPCGDWLGGTMFKEILQDLVDRTDGGVAGLLMASDGIAIDQYSRGDGPFDIESVGMEYSVVLKGVQRAAEMLDAGSTEEVSVQTERLTTIVRMLSDEYFVALAVAPGGNLGKARYLLRVSAPKLIENL